jgi:hypothetical protein
VPEHERRGDGEVTRREVDVCATDPPEFDIHGDLPSCWRGDRHLAYLNLRSGRREYRAERTAAHGAISPSVQPTASACRKWASSPPPPGRHSAAVSVPESGRTGMSGCWFEKAIGEATLRVVRIVICERPHV